MRATLTGLALAGLTVGLLAVPGLAGAQSPGAATASTTKTAVRGVLRKREAKDLTRVRVPGAGEVRGTVKLRTATCPVKLRVVGPDGDRLWRKRKTGPGRYRWTSSHEASEQLRVRVRQRQPRCRATYRVTLRLQPAEQADVTGPTPMAWGAVGDGVHDDTAALQAALDATGPGQTLVLPSKATFAHSRELTVRTPGARIVGAGTLLATNPARSAVQLMADGITLAGPTLRVVPTGQRYDSFEQMKLRLGPYAGITVEDVQIEGSAAAGVYVGGASGFRLANLTVTGTNADGIHITAGSSRGVLSEASVKAPGDDGIAIVSYAQDSQVTRDIEVRDSRVNSQRWGRGLAVVGGQQVDFRNVSVDRSAGACLYLASEAEWRTRAVQNVTVTGARFTRCNQQAAQAPGQRPAPSKGRVVHGAVHVYASQPGLTVRDVTLRDLTIRDTHPDGYDHVQVVGTGGARMSRLLFQDVTISGGSSYRFKVDGVNRSAVGWNP